MRLHILAAALAVVSFSGGATVEVQATPQRETATFGGGCFWCIEAVFESMQGVESAVSGYAGGTTDRPTYEQVCGGNTGHAEVVQVTFDPAAVSYGELLSVFFSVHDPTTVDRQGADVGPQYRSIILAHDDAQAAAARAVIAELTADGVFERPIVTEVVPLERFHAAEAYHQDFYERNPAQGYCQVVIAPKLAKFRAKYAAQIKPR